MGTLKVLAPGKPEVFEFNGQLREREAVAKVFEERMAEGGFLASVVESPGKSRQIGKDEFPLDDPEAEVILTPHLVGG